MHECFNYSYEEAHILDQSLIKSSISIIKICAK